jgi:hypothetical protein
VLDGRLDFHVFAETKTMLLESRNNETMPKSKNVMAVLEKCEKGYPGMMVRGVPGDVQLHAD